MGEAREAFLGEGEASLGWREACLGRGGACSSLFKSFEGLGSGVRGIRV